MKDLEPNAWNDFVASHKPGDVVRGKIARFASFGAFVELGDNLEGLCHISELSEDRVAKPEDVVFDAPGRDTHRWHDSVEDRQRTERSFNPQGKVVISGVRRLPWSILSR